MIDQRYQALLRMGTKTRRKKSLEAMNESSEGLPRFNTVEELFAELNS